MQLHHLGCHRIDERSLPAMNRTSITIRRAVFLNLSQVQITVYVRPYMLIHMACENGKCEEESSFDEKASMRAISGSDNPR